MISFFELIVSFNKIFFFRKGFFDGWCFCGFKLNSRSKEEAIFLVGERRFFVNLGVIDKILYFI